MYAARQALLITPEQLATELEWQPQVIVDCRFNLLKPAAGRQAWEAGHIPGAVYADLDADLAAPVRADTGRHPLPDPEAFAALLGSWGVTPETRVIVYDSAGGGIAARLWWLLRWVGHARVVLLDGGYPAWELAGLPVDTAQPELATGRYPLTPGSMPVLSTAEVQSGLQRGKLLLTDARDAQRFAGLKEPIDAVAGHVPGAVNLPFQDCLTESGRFRRSDELQQMFRQRLRIDARLPVACMCGSGVTACHTVFSLELSGLVPDQIGMPALYAGSWSEWIRAPNFAVETTLVPGGSKA